MPEVVIEVGPIDESLGPQEFEYRMRHQGCGELSQHAHVREPDTWRLRCSDCDLDLKVARAGMIQIWYSSADQSRTRDISRWVAERSVRCKVVPVRRHY